MNPNETNMDFDFTSLYQSAMYDEKSVYPKIKTVSALKPYMSNVYVEAFHSQTFNQNGNENAILKMKTFNTLNLIYQQLPVKEKIG